ncbi:A-kinase anchor protein 7-like isoform X2 [Zootermopsis nevadensis]|nr:A-kinase anchor protein 7-like isoform X2 [Zootermopsis nevadensis]XP_021928419.1 A-kinase anchor protein 7-like isoform X2 [Zootermopsis nevadensis]
MSKKDPVCDLEGKDMNLRSNYFVGIQVSNPEIHRMVKIVQEAILSKQPALRTAVVPIPTLHITLAVAHLPDMEHISRAAEVVENCGSIHRGFFSKPASLHFSGLKTFGNKVLFASIQQGEALEEVQMMASDLETSFQELTGSPTKKGFKPHLTILKLSKDFKLRRKGIPKISSSLYLDMTDTVFGSQVVQGIQLLSMNKPKDGNGYYYCSHQVAFDVSCLESGDHSECCKKPLSVKPNLDNVSQLQCTVKHEKGVIKRRFHSLSLARLSSVFGRTSESSDNADDKDVLMTLWIVSAASAAIIAAVRRILASK